MCPDRMEQTDSLKADIVIIGSGGGLAAAVAAGEAGASVILLEKVGILGGYTRQANALMACESPLQKRLGVSITSDELFRIFMNWNHWYRVDSRVVSAFLNKSGDTIRWLEEKGVEFELVKNDAGLAITHMPANMMASVQNALIKKARELGLTALLRTSGKKILRGPEGQVSGVLVSRDNNDFEIQTRSVIIATGGFGNNRKLLKKYCPDYYDGMSLDDWPNHEAHSGDGIFMAQEIGAAIADWVPIYHRGSTGGLGGPPWKPVLPHSMPQRMMWVNKKGKRFTDEASCGSMEGNMAGGNALFRQPDMAAYALFGTELVQVMEAGGPGLEEQPRKHAKRGGGAIVVSEKYTGLTEKIKKLVGMGKVKSADSWDEIAAWIGCDNEVLKAEINQYNAACDKGRDELFAKDRAYLVALRSPPYYAIQSSGSVVGETLGGIKVSENMEVLNKQGDIIPGVYAAGVLADGHQGQTYCYGLGGCAVGFAVNSGRIAGENAAQYVKSHA